MPVTAKIRADETDQLVHPGACMQLHTVSVSLRHQGVTPGAKAQDHPGQERRRSPGKSHLSAGGPGSPRRTLGTFLLWKVPRPGAKHLFFFPSNWNLKSKLVNLPYHTTAQPIGLSCLRRGTFQGWKVPKDPRGGCPGPRFSTVSCPLLLTGTVVLSN